MFDEPPPPLPPPPLPTFDATAPTAEPLAETQADGRVVIDLTGLVPPPPAEPCAAEAPDPFTPEIVVCKPAAGPSPRLGPMIGPVDDEFGSAIPRARVRLSDTATAEANAINQGVGGINANGGEVRLKIDF